MSSAPFTVPTPYQERDFDFALSPGSQKELRQTMCAATFIGKGRWKAVLGVQGYGAEVDRWVMGHPGWRETYAVRFRRPPIFGDIVAKPAREDHCIEYVVRIQRSKDGLHPDPWRTQHALTPMFEAFDRMRPADQPKSPRLFDSSQDHLYPPGYP